MVVGNSEAPLISAEYSGHTVITSFSEKSGPKTPDIKGSLACVIPINVIRGK